MIGLTHPSDGWRSFDGVAVFGWGEASEFSAAVLQRALRFAMSSEFNINNHC